MAAHEIDRRGIARHIAAHGAEPLAEGALQHADAMRLAVAFGHARAVRAVQAHGVNLIQIGEGAVLFGHIADRRDGGEVAVHRIAALETDQLGPVAADPAHQPVQIAPVVVGEDVLLHARAAHALDHGGVVQGVGKDHRPRQARRQRRQGRIIGRIARGEQQRRLLAVQIGQIALQQDVFVASAGDVARAARARAIGADCPLRRLDHLGVDAHRQIVVRAPDGDGPLAPVIPGVGPALRQPLQIGEDAIPALLLQIVQIAAEEVGEIESAHDITSHHRTGDDIAIPPGA
ncbi:hypothetical protein D3C73_1012770 [compost metagenome]